MLARFDRLDNNFVKRNFSKKRACFLALRSRVTNLQQFCWFKPTGNTRLGYFDDLN